MGLPHQDIADLQDEQQGLNLDVVQLQATTGREVQDLKAKIAALDARIDEVNQFFSPIIGQIRRDIVDMQFKLAKVTGDLGVEHQRVDKLEARVARLEANR